jgi:pentatricopeptide repeat protein
MCCQGLANDNRSEDLGEVSRKGLDFAERALEVARDDPGILANSALALAGFGEDISATIALVDRALALNPSFARGWHISGILRRWAGQPDVAIEHVETSLRLSPRARVGWGSYVIGSAHFLSRCFDEAVPKLLGAIQDEPGLADAYRHLVACYAHMGRLDEARDVVRRLRTITAVVIPSIICYRNPEHRELFLSGLRLAMGEEG